MGILYIVSTPIGNMEDITLRAVKTLQSVEYVACEDTRRAGLLLSQLQIVNKPKLISFYDEVELRKIPEIVTLLLEGKSVALISDAGTPTISDPGYKLVRECIRHSIAVESIPGPSAAIAALSISGLPTDKFLFIGYLPRKQGHRTKALEHIRSSLDNVKTTVIIYEAPHRLQETLGAIQSIFGDIHIVLVRELTKIHEEIRRESISEVLKHYSDIPPKGECVILFNKDYGNS